MNHALILNLAIIGLIAFALFFTGNALALIGIVFLKEMPYELMFDGDKPKESRKPMGFVDTNDNDD